MNKELTEQAITAEFFKQMNNKLNEAFESSLVRDFLMNSQIVAKKNKEDYQIAFIFDGGFYGMYNFHSNGQLYKASNAVPLGTVKNNDIYQHKILGADELKKVIKKTDEPNIEYLIEHTKNITGLGALVFVKFPLKRPYYDPKEIPTLTLLIEKSGIIKILQMLKKSEDRKEDKKFKPVEWTEKDIKIAEHKQMFERIRNYYKEYKKEFGDKLALEMTETVQKLSNVENFQVAMRREYGSISKGNIQAYLYAFLLDQQDTFGFVRWMKNNKQLVALYNHFHPGKEIE